MMKINFKLALALLMLPMMAMAQEKTADEFKNEGNALVKEKKFKEALASYQQAITLWGDSVDAATVYNAGDCARRIEDFETSNKLYQQSIDLGYKKADFATYYIAENYGKMKLADERLAQLEKAHGIVKDPKVVSIVKKALTKEYAKKANAQIVDGNKILGEIQASTKPEQRTAIEARAKEVFQAAKEWNDKALAVDPNSEDAKKIGEIIDSQLK